MPLTLIKNAEVYTPEPVGRVSVLICNEKIEKIGNIDAAAIEKSGLEIEILDAEGCILSPGFIDPHEHLLGGSGEEGFSSQTPEIHAVEIISAGITCVVGCLGVDTTMKTMPGLLAKAKALKEEGLTAYVWTGGYKTPPATINSSISTDMMFIEEIIGIGEIAIADDRSTEPTPQELARIVSEAHNSGVLSRKCGLTHFHIGEKDNRLALLKNIVDNFNVSAEWLYPTHIGRSRDLMFDAIEISKRGAYVDLDTVDEDLVEKLNMYFELKGWDEKLTLSSDASRTAPQNLYSQVQQCILSGDFEIQEVLRLVTANTAAALKLTNRGRLKEGNAADLLVIEPKSFALRDVFCNGKWLFKDGQPNFKEQFLRESNRHISLEGEKRSEKAAGQQTSDPNNSKNGFGHGIKKVDPGNDAGKRIFNIDSGESSGAAKREKKYFECHTAAETGGQKRQSNNGDKRSYGFD